MSIDDSTFEARQYTVQHDRILHAVSRQVRDLEARLTRLESMIDHNVAATHFGTEDPISAIRASSTGLSAELQQLESSMSPPATTDLTVATTAEEPAAVRQQNPVRQRPTARRRPHTPGWQPTLVRERQSS